jgi:hypothetical protein
MLAGVADELNAFAADTEPTDDAALLIVKRIG